MRLSDELDGVMLQFIPLGCAAYAAANFYFFYDLNSKAIIPGAVGCGVVLLYHVTPLQKMLKVRLRKQEQELSVAALSETTKTYEESVVDFFKDYDRENPVTTVKANKVLIELINSQKGEGAAEIAQAISGNSGGLRSFAKSKAPVAKTYITQKRQKSNKIKELSNVGKLVETVPSYPAAKPAISAYQLALIKNGNKKPTKGGLSALTKKA